ncbi:MAG: hypothetical protein WKF28_09190, partial [Rubrobacteraceae bacterium]
MNKVITDQLTIQTDSKNRIFSHIRQKWLVETPEERVRQDYLCTLVGLTRLHGPIRVKRSGSV